MAILRKLIVDCKTGKEKYEEVDDPTWVDKPYIPKPTLCTHWAQVNDFDLTKTKPLQVRRTWEGKEYVFWCYVTREIKDLYDAGQLTIDDYVLVDFIEDDRERPLATEKIVKTW